LRYFKTRFILCINKIIGNIFMSNNSNQKSAMTAVVSAAQKSVNNNLAHTPDSHTNKASNIVSEKNIKTALNEASKSQEDIIKSSVNTLQETQKATHTPEKQESTETKATQEKHNTPHTHHFNHNIVTMLCDGIKDIHNQSLDFAEKLRQRREHKEKSLSTIQTMTIDNINALSNTCIEATRASLKSKHPIDMLQNHTKTVTQIHTIYTTMIADFSKSSLDMMQKNVSSCWFSNHKK
jgi:hypothetical protein